MFVLDLVTPEKSLITGEEVEEVIIPAYKGELNVLPRHAPLVSTLSEGVLRYRQKGVEKFVEVMVASGYCEVSPKGVHILAETADAAETIDKDRARKALETAEDKLKSGNLGEEEIVKYQRKLRRARVRLSLIR